MAPFARIRRGPNAGATQTESALTVHDIGRRAAAGAALMTAKGGFQQVFGLASTIVVTRLLLPQQLGVFAIATTVSTFLWMLGGGQGMAGGLIRRTTPPEHADLRAFVALQLWIGVILAGIVALATLPFGLVGQVTAVMMSATPIAAFRGAGLVVLERQLLYRQLATAEMAELFAYYSWTVVTVALGWGVWGLATATIARSFVGTSFMVALSPTRIVWPRYDRQRVRALLGIGVRVQAVELVAALRDQILLLVTVAVASLSVVAYWSVVLRVVQVPGMLLTALLRVAFPAMSRVQSSGGDASQMLRRALPAAAIVVGALFVPLAGAAPAFIPLLLGSRWSPAAGALPLVCLAGVILTPLAITGQSYLWAIGDARSPLQGIVADAIVLTAVGLPLVPLLGVTALGIGCVAAAIVHTAIIARAAGRQAGIHVFRLIRMPLFVWVVAAGVAWICAQTAGPLLIRTVVSTCVALGLYVGLLVLVRRELLREMAAYGLPVLQRYLLRRKAVPVPTTT
jgi:O-antigen/teichoic acid export membrane protein